MLRRRRKLLDNCLRKNIERCKRFKKSIERRGDGCEVEDETGVCAVLKLNNRVEEFKKEREEGEVVSVDEEILRIREMEEGEDEMTTRNTI